MSKSPLNFGLFGGARAALRGGRGRKQLAGRINKLENQVGVLMKARYESMDPLEMGTQEPMYETAVQGDVADNVIQSNPTNFDPNTVEAASEMFGEEMPNSFDRNMGQKLY